MPAERSSACDPIARRPDRGARRSRRISGLLVALLSCVAAFALPVSPAFGEGSVDLNTGPGDATRQSLWAAPGAFGASRFTVLYVYAEAGERLQLGSSAVGNGAGNIRVYQRGTVLEGLDFPADPAFTSDIFDCVTDDPGTGLIADGAVGRAQELAGPAASGPDLDPNTWTPCEYEVTTSGIYPVMMIPPNAQGTNNDPGTVDVPIQGAGTNIPIWDITVRDAIDGAASGRVFTNEFTLRTQDGDPEVSSGVEVFVYTKTGYEYEVNLFNQSGVNWTLSSDDQGLVDATTKERLFASFACDTDVPTNNSCDDFRAEKAPRDRSYPLFVNRPDAAAISGPGGLAATRGFATAPITPGSAPVANAAFTGSAGQTGGTNRGSGGTISFTTPTQMAGLPYTVEIDTNRDGTFGNGSDFVDDSNELQSDGTNAFAWGGRNGQSAVPPCGDYNYRIRSTLAEVHFTMLDVETSGGMQIERLTLPNDPALGDPLAASYNDIDPFKGYDVLPNTNPNVAVNQTSGPGFHAWGPYEGDVDYIDTWAQLPAVQTTGTLRLLCADPQIRKVAEPAVVVPGEDLVFRLEVTNNGPDAATNVVARDDLPSTVTFESASPGCSQVSGVVTCTLASLAPNATHTFEIRVSVPSDVDECIDNEGTVSNDTPDTNLANNSSSNCWPIRGRSDLSISKDASRTELPAEGGQVMYTLVVRNHGPSDDTDVTVTDPLAAGLTLVAADPSQGRCTTTNNTVSCDMGTLKEDGSAQVLVTVNVHGSPGCITNTSTVRGANEDPTPANNQDSAQVCVTERPPPPPFDLDVVKRANDLTVVVGQPVTYTIVVTNNGPAAAPDVKLTDTLNAPVTVVSVRTTAGTCTSRIPMSCELGTIAAGDRVTVTIVAKHREATGCADRQRNAASAVGNGTDSNPANNMDTVDVCVSKVRLLLSKVGNRRVVRGGQTFSYLIRVRNPTKGEARNVRVCDRLPSGLRYVSSRPRARVSGRQRCWTIRLLGAGARRTFRITVRAANGASGRRTNTATVSSPDINRVLRSSYVVRIRPRPDRPTG